VPSLGWRYILTLFAIGIEPTTTESLVESEQHQASDVVPRDGDVTRQTSVAVETDRESLLEQQIKIRQSKIIDITLSLFFIFMKI